MRWLSSILLFTVLSLQSLNTIEANDEVIDNCPSFCACSVKACTRGILVNCTARNLSNVPGVYPSGTEDLLLDHNHITNVDLTQLPLMTNLVKLVISHSKVESVLSLPYAHGNLPKLELLDLSHNDLKQVPSNLPRTLRVLHLSYNKIQDIQGITFSSLRKLHELYLNNNLVRRVTSASFHGETDEEVTLPNLDKLSLRRNNIQAVAPKAFENLISLTYLNLAKNRLTTLEGKTFYRLLDLEHLDLHANKLQTIEDEALYMLKSLKFLSLKSNLLPSVPRGLPMLEWLDLSHNRIRNVSSEQRTDIYPAELFVLAHNPLHCDCNLLWLKEIFDRREYLLKHIELKPEDFIPTCASPKRVAGESWDNLGDDMFTCEDDDSDDLYEDSSKLEELRVNPGLVHDKTVQVTWTYRGKQSYDAVYIQYYIFGQRSSSTKHVEVSAAQREYTLRHLRSESSYIICVIPKLINTEDDNPEKIKPLSLDHCIEVTTLATNMLENVSFLAVAGYYMLGMAGTVIAVFSCIGGLALLYGLWNQKNTDWSAKYAMEAASPDLDIHTMLSRDVKTSDAQSEDASPSEKKESEKQHVQDSKDNVEDEESKKEK